MQKILIVHTGGGLGDVLLSTPVIEALRFNFPDAEIDFLARTSTSAAIKNHPSLHKVITINSAKPGWLKAAAWAKKLKAEKYDAALILWSTSQLAYMLYLADIPVRVGQDSRLLYSWTYTNPVCVRSEHGDTSAHWSEILLDFVRSMRLPVPPCRPLFVIPKEAEKKADELLKDLPDFSGPIIGFHPSKGIKNPEKRWPVSVFAEYAAALVKELNARLIITGGPQEEAMIENLVQKSGIKCLNLAGKTDTDTLAAVMKRCAVFVCPDSGPAHLAAICGTPTADIFALKEDFPNRWAPIGAPSVKLIPEAWDCREVCRKGTCSHFSCYKHITPQMIVNAVKKLLK